MSSNFGKQKSDFNSASEQQNDCVTLVTLPAVFLDMGVPFLSAIEWGNVAWGFVKETAISLGQ